MKNWLEIAVGLFLIGMVLYGHYKGFIRLAVSLVALIATLMIVNSAMPKVTVFLRDKTPVYTWVQQSVEKTFGLDKVKEAGSGDEMPSVQRKVIESLNIPKELKGMLIENNNNEVYQMLGVDAFTDYIGDYLANIILSLVGYIAAFIIVYIIIRLIMRALDVVARLPILSGLNRITGALLGGIQGLILLWIGFLVLTACSGTAWGMLLIKQIEASSWLSFLYHYNIVSKLALSIIQGIFS